MYEVAWTEINSKYNLVCKRKTFKTAEAMYKFMVKLHDSGNLYQINGTRSPNS